MRDQLLAIIWAQFRITRNHFPRTSFGTVLSWTVSALWYLLFVAMALAIMWHIESVSADSLLLSVSTGLLAIFTYLQVVPLLTASTGWSLQLDKLQAFPIPSNTLFLIEVVLRLTGAPEMLILLAGGLVGLALRSDLSWLAPLALLLFVPFTLFIQLAIRDFILHSFSRNRFREVLTVFFLCFAFIPQLLVRQRAIHVIKPYFLLIANGRATPWHQMAALGTGSFSWNGFAAVLCWNVFAGITAHRQFMKSLRQEDSFRPAAITTKSTVGLNPIAALTRRFPDPFAAMVEKELRTLLRMPRFRVLFGMACVFSVFVFLPVSMESADHGFMSENAIPVTSLYGLLLLSDALLLNSFGFDRGAAQLYFISPPALSLIIRAKNLAAILLVGLQATLVPLLSILFRMHATSLSVLTGLICSAAATVFLLAAGNMLSVYFPRANDPKSAFRNQRGARVQLWLLACSLGMFILVGFAFLARWATQHDWAMLAVLGFEFAVGLIVYRISLQSAVEYAHSHQEEIVNALSRSTSPLSS